MDLIVESRDYKYSYQRLEMSYIHIFLSNKLKREAENFVDHFLTKKEVKELIEYLKTCDFSSDDQREKLIEELSNMEMLMIGQEKARFYFW